MDEETSKLQHTLLGTMDAMVWAEEFCRIFDGVEVSTVEFGDGTPVVDPGLMVGWFANAMQVAININRTHELHAAGELTETEEFLQRWHEEHPDEVEETWDDEAVCPNDEIIDLVDALVHGEEEARAREDSFLEGFNEGRDEHDYIDPYGDTP